MDELYLETPTLGSRQMRRMLIDKGIRICRSHVQRLMREMGIRAIYAKPKTSVPHPSNPVYPYLLKDMEITRPMQVWCTDITYIPMKRGFMYLVAIVDWYSRAVLSWRISNTMDTDFCLDALNEALGKYGRPDVFNSDQGSQFTSQSFTGRILEVGTKISMDGRGRWRDNVIIERLWRSLKQECLYINDLETPSKVHKLLRDWFAFYNERRPHTGVGGAKPMQVFQEYLEKVVKVIKPKNQAA